VFLHKGKQRRQHDHHADHESAPGLADEQVDGREREQQQRQRTGEQLEELAPALQAGARGNHVGAVLPASLAGFLRRQSLQ